MCVCVCSFYFDCKRLQAGREFDYGVGELLGAVAKLRIATVSFVTSVCPSAWNNSAPTAQIFMKFDISIFFEILLRKLKFD